ncbi:MAG: tRNA 2-thiouridine(34) synthase MnmA [Acidobacteria bacterium]|nr:tRNA 2-thiouridine(34) synthase MnmA [Acidobacteriota bacterium]
MKGNVIVGLSGGVDSAVAALLLKERGYQVTGVFMRNWEGQGEACTVEDDHHEARLVAAEIGIPFYSFNFSDRYWDRVFERFLAEYKAGLTPNPDILCNKEIKFQAFLDRCVALDADLIATGHYARIVNRSELWKGVDASKDQSYFLYAVPGQALSRAVFPLGDLHKSEVRDIARSKGLPNFARKDSVGICFVGQERFKSFLKQYLGDAAGDIVDPEGRVLGRHDGVMYHTIGQRKGLGVGGPGEPWFVVGKDVARKEVIAAQGADHPLLFAPALLFSETCWVNGEPDWPFRGTAKIRYRQSDQGVAIKGLGEGMYLAVFDEPQRAISPGQSIVVYEGERCLGGGVIVKACTRDGLSLTTVQGVRGGAT